MKGWFSIALHKLLRREPRQRGRQVNINEVSEEVNNQDSRYQRGHVINICGQRLNMDSPFKPLAHGYSMCQHKCRCKTHFLDLSGTIFFLIRSPFFSRRRSKDIRFKTLARVFFLLKNCSIPIPAKSFSSFFFGKLNGSGYKAHCAKSGALLPASSFSTKKNIPGLKSAFFLFWGPFMRHVCLGAINEARPLARRGAKPQVHKEIKQLSQT